MPLGLVAEMQSIVIFKYKTRRFIMSTIVTVMLIYHRHKPVNRINLLGSQWRRNVFPVNYEHSSSSALGATALGEPWPP
jgi:hypothetical protein